MALVGSNICIDFPSSPGLAAGSATASETSVLLDAANEACGMVMCVAKAGTIKKVLFNTGTVTTGATLTVTINTVSATTGGPNVVLASTTVAVAATDDNVAVTAVFSSGLAVTRGQLIAVQIANPASSFGNLNINNHTASFGSTYFPYVFTFLSGALAKVRAAPCIALEYDDGSYAYVPGLMPITAGGFTSETVSVSTTPDEVGIKFSVPFPIKVGGLWWAASSFGGSTLAITLYDSDGTTVLETVSIDTEQVQTTSAGTKFVEFAGEYSLSANTFYRATIAPASTTGITFGGIQVATPAMMDGFPGGRNIIRTDRADAGAWSDWSLKRPWMGVLITGFSDGAGGGGIPRSRAVNMAGARC